MSDKPALVKSVFDHAIQNQGEPLRFLSELTQSFRELVNNFNAAMEFTNSFFRMQLHQDAADIEFCLYEDHPDELEDVVKVSIIYERPRNWFIVHFDANPEGRAEGGTLEIDDYPVNEAGMQRLSVDCVEKILKSLPERAWRNYMNYLDAQAGQRGFDFN